MVQPSRNHFNGEILTDITSFSIIQKFLDKPKETSLFQLANLESLIETLLFHEKIFIIGPTHFGSDFTVPVPPILESFVEKKAIEVYSPDFCSGKDELIRLYNETINFIMPDTIETFYRKHNEIEQEINDYASYVNYGKQRGTIELAKIVGITKEHEINMLAHLLRTNIHFKCLHNIERKVGGMVSYSPHMARISLVDELCNRYENRIMPISNRLIAEMKEHDKKRKNEWNIKTGSKFEVDLPLLTPWVLSQCSKIDDIFDEILNIKNTSEVVKFRNWCIGFQEAIYNDDIPTMKKYSNQFEAVKSKGSIRQIIRDVPSIDFNLGESVDMNLAVSRIFSNVLNFTEKCWKTKDLIFLTNIKNFNENNGYSRDRLEKEFQIRLKA